MTDQRRTVVTSGPLRAQPRTPSAAGVRSDTVHVASSTSTPASRAGADVVCDANDSAAPAIQGLVDDLAALPTGGSLRFAEGTYRFATAVILPPGPISLYGAAAWATVLDFDPDVMPADADPVNDWVYGMFLCDRFGVYLFHGLGMRITPRAVTTFEPDYIDPVLILSTSTDSPDIAIDRCWLDASAGGLALNAYYETQIT